MASRTRVGREISLEKDEINDKIYQACIYSILYASRRVPPSHTRSYYPTPTCPHLTRPLSIVDDGQQPVVNVWEVLMLVSSAHFNKTLA